jgi:FMN phosphatase YigB (HAD superfamily)
MSKKSFKKKVISFDIDGVLNDYPKCFVVYVNKVLHSNFKNIEQIKKKLRKYKYEKIKDKYRRSNYKFNLKPNIFFRDFIDNLNEKYHVICITRRNFKKYPRMYIRTLGWLKKNSFKITGLYSKNKNVIKKKKVCLHIDDQLSDVKKYLNLKTKFFVLGSGVNKKIYFVNRKNLLKKFRDIEPML